MEDGGSARFGVCLVSCGSSGSGCGVVDIGIGVGSS